MESLAFIQRSMLGAGRERLNGQKPALSIAITGFATNRSFVLRQGFTLVELMISIALVLILLLGVNQVFRMSSDTVGAGQTLSAFNRDMCAAEAVMADDFRNVAQDAPLFIICCSLARRFDPASDSVGVFLTRDDERNDVDGDHRTIDLNGDGKEYRPKLGAQYYVPYEHNPGTIYAARSQRVDRIIFPVRGSYRRQTANDGSFTSPTTSHEALLWYGHLATNRNPGSATPYYANPAENGKGYAAEWVLGRVAMLLRDPAQIGSEMAFQRVPPDPANTTSPRVLSPLSFTSAAPDGALYGSARYDLACTTHDTVRGDIATWEAAGYTLWWQGLLYDASSGRDYRFAGEPSLRRPVTSAVAARVMPFFVPNASQFIVEYAGDYLQQDNNPQSSTYGKLAGTGNDGQIDYVVDKGVKRIRWYGHARDVNGDGIILGSWLPGRAGKRPPDELVDVVPLWEICNALQGAGLPYAPPANAPREVEVLGDTTGRGRVCYLDTTDPAFDLGRPGQCMTRYTCVWKNGTPAMVRVMIRQDDPYNRLRTGRWSEFVFNLR